MAKGGSATGSRSVLSSLVSLENKGGSAAEGRARKRLLAVVIHIFAASAKTDRSAVLQTLKSLTGQDLSAHQVEKVFAYLLREDAPDLERILAGADRRERRFLLRAAVQTWSAFGIDSDQATLVTERIVGLLGFEPDAICTTLDRLWLEDRARAGFFAACRAMAKLSRLIFRTGLRAMRALITLVAPHARQLGTRALASLQR